MEKFLLRAKVGEWDWRIGKWTNRWAEGYLGLVCFVNDEPKFEFVELYQGDYIYYFHKGDHDEEARKPVTHGRFARDTVSRWTGLLDKNGKKIFEGDVVLDYYGRQRWVEFFDGRYLPFNAYPEYKCLAASECVVIGNRWDNPELVKEP